MVLVTGRRGITIIGVEFSSPILRRGSTASMSFVLATLRALHIDSFVTATLIGTYRESSQGLNPQNVRRVPKRGRAAARGTIRDRPMSNLKTGATLDK